MESERTEIINKKIEEFIQERPDDFLKLVAQIDKKTRWIMKGYFDEDEHGGMQMYLNATEKMEDGERNWDYEKVKIEAMIYNTACSLATSELKKFKGNKKSIVNYDDLAGEDNGEEDNYQRTESTYIMTEICDDAIVKMLKNNLQLIDGDIDLIAIEVMDAIMNSKAETRLEIAELLKIEEREVRNAIERIRRARNKVWAKLSEIDKEWIDSLKIDYRIKDILKKTNKVDDEEYEESR